jgi:branched-chain amino acid transport system substrate-binding protein
LTPVVLAIKSPGADIIGSYFSFPNDQAIFARQLRQLGVTLPWVGSPTTVNAETVKLAGPALSGTYSVADYAVDSSRRRKNLPISKAPSRTFRQTITVRGPMTRSACFTAAINKAGSTDPDKIRVAILSTKGYEGAEGGFTFDEFGDGLRGYNIVRNEKGVIVFNKHIEFTD